VKPLSGFRVVDFSQLIAGPSATAILAELGATVVKVESRTGDPARNLRRASTPEEASSPTYRAYNAGKRSIVLDLKDDGGREVARALAAQADVLVESFRPGVMGRLGLGRDELRELNPRLVYASLAGFGFGPVSSGRRGVDLVIQAESGLMSVTGFADGPPTKVGFTIVDAAAGHVLGESILAALLHRERTGEAKAVRVSLLDVALHLQAGPLAEYVETAVVPERAGNAAPTSAPADLLRVKDGFIVVSAYLDAHWRALCRTLDLNELLDDPRFATVDVRLLNRAELCLTLERALARETAEVWLSRLTEQKIVAGTVKDYAQVVSSVEAREGNVIGEAGLHHAPVIRSPFVLSEMERTDPAPAPSPGEHSEEILAELGYSTEQVDRLLNGTAVTGS
jgi:crotonobetainyl-CoA:carnitine CoA-transferase CaiB-like acyl-CoA transferase